MKKKQIAILLLSVIVIFAACSVRGNTGKKGHEGETDYAEFAIPIPRNWDKFAVRENFSTQELVYEMGLGINMGNTLEATDSPDNRWINARNITDYIRAWGAEVPTKETIEGYAKAGFSSLRIPVSWSNLMDMNTFTINSDLFDIVENVVNWTIDCGMVAIINLHWDGGWWYDYPVPEKRDEVMARYVAIWTQVSERFKKYGDPLIFENMNEVGFDSVWNQWGGTQEQKEYAFDLKNELNQVFVDLVRASGGNNANRHLLIDVYYTHSEFAYDPLFKWPDDPANRYALSVHYYTPSLFCIVAGGEDTGWFPGAIGTYTWGTAADRAELARYMDALKQNCVDKGMPVIIGEYGANGKNREREQIWNWTVSVTEAVYSRGMAPMLWDTPGSEYDRRAHRFTDPVLIRKLMEIPAKHPR